MKNRKLLIGLWVGLMMFLVGGVRGQGFAGRSDSQNYIDLTDGNGFPKTEFLDALAAASSDLIDAFPEEYSTFFKVYDYGEYPIESNYEYGVFEDKMSWVIQEKVTTPYYLIFGRELNESGAVSNVRVELKLPEDGCFSSISETMRDIIEHEVYNALNEADGSVEQKLAKEKIAIKRIEEIVTCIKNCCDNGNASSCLTDCLGLGFEAVKSELKEDGYLEFKYNKVHIYNLDSTDDPSIHFELDIPDNTVLMDFTSELSEFVTLVGGESPSFFKYDFTESIPVEFVAPHLSETGHLYKENILIFKLPNNERRLFYKISTDLIGQGLNFQESSDREGERAMVAPAIWLLKRCAMGGIEVLVEVGIYWAFEKYASNCPWIEAWGQLHFNFWSLMLTFADGAIGSTQISLLIALFKPLVIYLFTGEESRASTLNWNAVGKMLTKGFSDALIQEAFGKVFKGVSKVIGKEGREAVAQEIKHLNDNGLLEKYCKDLIKMDINNFYKFVENPGMVKAWDIANIHTLKSDDIDFLSVLHSRLTNSTFPFTSEIAEDIFVRAEILDEIIGANEAKNIIAELIGSSKFKNHEDLLKNLDNCFVNSVPNVGKLKTQLNEFREGQYWIGRGGEVAISKELNPGQQFNNEVDGLLFSIGGILECKYPNIPGPNAMNNVFANLELIIKKFTTESKLTQYWKDIYPKRYGQINIANGSFTGMTEVNEFVQAVKDAGIVGTEPGVSMFTLIELKSLDELHIVIDELRIIIKPENWD